ncbi:MAG: TonB-dependent receptor [Pseudomonadota bacterium]
MRAILLAGGFAAASGLAWAQEPIEMNELLVTGGRTPIDVDETGRAFTVITGEQLEARGTRYLADALRQVPGLAVSRTGSFGGLTQIRVRGAEANQVLVLVDGVELSPAGSGEVDFGSLIVSDIERIEVLRGPQSALFGSNAASGVISIITRRGERGEVSFGGAAEGGSDGSVLVSANVAGGGETWDAAFGARFRRTDGFNVATGSDDRDGELDGDRNVTLTGRANWSVTPDLSVGANVFVVDRESEFDDQLFPFPSDETTGLVVDSDEVNDATDIAVGAFARYEMLNDALVHTVSFGYTNNTSDSLTDGALSFGTDSQRFKAAYQGSFAFETGEVQHLLTGLFEFEEERNESSSGFDQDRTLFGVGGEYRIAYGPAALQASLRNDFNDAFEDALTFAVSASYSIEQTGTRLHGSVGRGVVNPTFFEQFGFSPDFFIGNPDLIPERTFQWDIGVEQTLLDGRLIVDATYYRGEVTDEIVSGFNADAGLSTSVNAEGESPRQGVELSLTAFPLENLAITGSYTYTLAEEGSTGRQEVRRARHLASMDATYTFLEGRARLNANIAYNGDQRDLDFTDGFFTVQPLVTLDDFVLLSVQGSYAFTENVELFARVENATNADYQEVFQFETQGVAGFAGLRVRF